MLLQDSNWSVSTVAIPNESHVFRMYEKPDLADAYAIRLPKNAITNPEVIARFLFSHQAPWVVLLMQLRDALVGRFGIKTSEQLHGSGDNCVGIFKIYDTGIHEIVMGANDIHLDFRLSVLLHTKMISADSEPYSILILSTVVHCHNLLGRVYIKLITPFHRMVVRSALSRAARIGWPIG
jgi:hypothetical protein